MRKFGLIGYPISHSGSPALFKELCPCPDCSYELVETPSFDEAWQQFIDGYEGVNITSPFKEKAFDRARMDAEACGRPWLIDDAVRSIGAANIAVKTPDGIHLYNSDCLAVREIISGLGLPDAASVAVVGFGGAGKAAAYAAQSLGLKPTVHRHNGISGGLDADLVIYTLPKAVPGIERISCGVLLESNYKDPAFSEEGLNSRGARYIDGMRWLRLQAEKGYGLLVGKI